MEKQNKAVREKKRKEEVKRIRSLVELAYSTDPRVSKFKAEEKKKKEEEKIARQGAIRLKKEQEEKVSVGEET